MLAKKITISDHSFGAGHSNRLISVADVRTMFGGVSDMTLWRWLKDANLEFPEPIYVQRRRFWHEAELIDWIRIQPSQITD